MSSRSGMVFMREQYARALLVVPFVGAKSWIGYGSESLGEAAGAYREFVADEMAGAGHEEEHGTGEEEAVLGPLAVEQGAVCVEGSGSG